MLEEMRRERRRTADQVVDAHAQRLGERGQAAQAYVLAPARFDLCDRRPTHPGVVRERLPAPAGARSSSLQGLPDPGTHHPITIRLPLPLGNYLTMSYDRVVRKCHL